MSETTPDDEIENLSDFLLFHRKFYIEMNRSSNELNVIYIKYNGIDALYEIM